MVQSKKNHLQQIQDDCYSLATWHLDRSTEIVTPAPLHDSSVGNNPCFINIIDSLLNKFAKKVVGTCQVSCAVLCIDPDVTSITCTEHRTNSSRKSPSLWNNLEISTHTSSVWLSRLLFESSLLLMHVIIARMIEIFIVAVMLVVSRRCCCCCCCLRSAPRSPSPQPHLGTPDPRATCHHAIPPNPRHAPGDRLSSVASAKLPIMQL